MTYTSHGHHVLGTTVNAQRPAKPPAPCGGPMFCYWCKDEAQAIAKEMVEMSESAFEASFEALSRPDKAIALVYGFVKTNLEKTDTHVEFTHEDVYVVWFCKTLQNWKALVSTTLPDGMYYEVTHNGDDAETYIDAYKKFQNVVVPD